ncbi:unnamed protein product [Dracunculus medinensis]|uniref:PHD-type domain-containing protein n=1 Tax=Dracunculus medinensis TaxID=318479 RepID=A0A0N4U3T8_DRAME|nr:unnamed protein product [Dracunculus medinensis]
MKQSKGLEGGHHSHSKESKNLDEVAKQFKEGKTSYGDKRRLSDRSNEEDEEAKKFEVIGVGVIEQLRGNKKENLKKKQLKLAKEFINSFEDSLDVWICPVCSVAYVDGACDMVCCDHCDNWFHWSCVGLVLAPPAEVPWYCNNCAKKKSLKRKSQSSGVSMKKMKK